MNTYLHISAHICIDLHISGVVSEWLQLAGSCAVPRSASSISSSVSMTTFSSRTSRYSQHAQVSHVQLEANCVWKRLPVQKYAKCWA